MQHLETVKTFIIRGSLKASTLSFNYFKTIIIIKQYYQTHINLDLEKFKTSTTLRNRIKIHKSYFKNVYSYHFRFQTDEIITQLQVVGKLKQFIIVWSHPNNCKFEQHFPSSATLLNKFAKLISQSGFYVMNKYFIHYFQTCQALAHKFLVLIQNTTLETK